MLHIIQKYRNYIYLHLIVFVWGFTGILGKLISLPPVLIVWYRMGIAFLGLWLICIYMKKKWLLSVKSFFPLFLVGVLISLHWLFFFASIKASTVSVALVCISSTAFFTAVMQPIILKVRFQPHEIILSIFTILGVYLIFQFEGEYFWGITFSIISAFLASLFTVINSIFVKKQEAVVIGFYEMLGGFFVITLYLIATQNTLAFPLTPEIFYLLILGLICTSIAFASSIHIMKELSPFTISISVNMEPIYAILLALIIFGDAEHMTIGFYFGGGVITASVFANSFVHHLVRVRKNKALK